MLASGWVTGKPEAVGILAIIWRLPRFIRMLMAYTAASADIRAGRYLAAKEKLQGVYERDWPKLEPPAPHCLLLAFVYLKLGHMPAAAEMALEGVRQASQIVRYVDPVDRDYMRYVGKVIYEKAMPPLQVDVGVEREDLRLDRVRPLLLEEFPLEALEGASGSAQH